jgi:hypothetical protein
MFLYVMVDLVPGLAVMPATKTVEQEDDDLRQGASDVIVLLVLTPYQAPCISSDEKGADFSAPPRLTQIINSQEENYPGLGGTGMIIAENGSWQNTSTASRACETSS